MKTIKTSTKRAIVQRPRARLETAKAGKTATVYMFGNPVKVPIIVRTPKVSARTMYVNLATKLEKASPVELAVTAGQIVENPELGRITFGGNRTPILVGGLGRNLENWWGFYNKRLADKRAGKPVSDLVTDKEAIALRKHLLMYRQRLDIHLTQS